MIEKAPPSYDPPQDGEVQLDVFGPGVGECLLVHMGRGSYLVVDSCVGRGRTRPAALEFLDAIGADPAQIELIVATHWHDDHVRGIADVFAAATSATFCIAASVRPTEFYALTGAKPVGSRFTSGVDELSHVARLAEGRGLPLKSVAGGQRLLHKPGEPVSEVWSFSPSPEDLAASRQHLASVLPWFRPGARRIPALPPNDTSVVLYLETVGGPMLLGGDLEHPASRLRGWHAIMDAEELPQAPARVVKVPHHGSENAHCPEVWSNRIHGDAIAVLTPFERGSVPLPRPSDRERLRNLTPNGWLTSDKRTRSKPLPSVTAKTIREATRRFTPQTLEMGHVQLRAGGGGWSIRVSDEAVAV